MIFWSPTNTINLSFQLFQQSRSSVNYYAFRPTRMPIATGFNVGGWALRRTEQSWDKKSRRKTKEGKKAKKAHKQFGTVSAHDVWLQNADNAWTFCLSVQHVQRTLETKWPITSGWPISCTTYPIRTPVFLSLSEEAGHRTRFLPTG